jgi:hypothetical protein
MGIAILSYLSVLWMLKEPIGTRPLLTLGVLCTVAGLQFFAIGLMAELVVRTTIRPREVFSIRAVRNITRPPPVPPPDETVPPDDVVVGRE